MPQVSADCDRDQTELAPDAAVIRPVSGRVHLFKKYLISGCFGHAARLSRSIVSSS